MPHYHVLLRQGYCVWTYTHPVKAPRQIRRLTERLFDAGHRPLILQCERSSCRIYPTTTLTEEAIRHQIDRVRPTHDSYVQIAPAPPS